MSFSATRALPAESIESSLSVNSVFSTAVLALLELFGAENEEAVELGVAC